jgi:hypothetical protein
MLGDGKSPCFVEQVMLKKKNGLDYDNGTDEASYPHAALDSAAHPLDYILSTR